MSQMKQLLEKLAEPVNEDLIKTKPGIKDRNGNDVQIRYLEWHAVTDILDNVHAEWETHIKEVGHINGQIYVRVALTIAGVTRENVGFEDSQTDTFGDPFSNAYAMALKRSAALFGIGRALYRASEKTSVSSPEEPKTGKSRGQNSTALATEKQRNAILSILADSRLTGEELDRLNILLNDPDLSRQKASEALEYFLGASEKQKGVWVKTTPGVLRSRKQQLAA